MPNLPTDLLNELRECLAYYADDDEYGVVYDNNGRFGAEQKWTTFAGDSSAAKRGLEIIDQILVKETTSTSKNVEDIPLIP
jgi:lipocalin